MVHLRLKLKSHADVDSQALNNPLKSVEDPGND
jgi:hypothetical protein